MSEGRSTCRFCGSPIWWFKSRNDKFYSCDSDRKRDSHQCHAHGNQSPLAERDESGEVNGMMQRVIQPGYRTLVLALHPDRGGNHDDMTNLNTAVQRLREATGVRRVTDRQALRRRGNDE